MFVGLNVGINALMSSVWSPTSIFTANEPGWMYDNSDMSTLFQDSAGTIPVTAVGQPVGLQFDKSKGTPAARRNLLTYTEQFDNAAWTTGAVNLASFSAGRITPNTTLGQHRLDRATTIQAAAHTFSLEIKPDGYGFIWLRLGLVGAVFNATTGVATNVSAGVTASSSPASDGYFRVSISVVTSANDTARINASSTTTSADFAGDGTSGVLIRKAQLELGSTATNYQRITTGLSGEWTPGTHRTQSTAASRPTFACLPVTGRRNLLTYTDQFDNAVWFKSQVSAAADAGMAAYKVTASAGLNSHRLIAAAVTLASGVQCVHSVYMKAGTHSFAQIHDGASASYYANFNLATGVVGTATGCTATMTDIGSGWYRCSIAMTLNIANPILCVGVVTSDTSARNESWTAVGTETFFVRSAQLEQSAAATNYQKVVSLYDITEAGVQTAYGLYYDGVDDFLVTPTITPGTDKVQVFAGVRKLSDAATAMIVEHSAALTANNGSFYLVGPSSGGLANYSFGSKGTISAVPVASGFAAPISNVVTGLGDISGDRVTIRVNGSQVAQNTSDQGTGNYLAYPAYFGRRGGTTLPFNGYTFREVGRFGPNLDTATIANVENWINQNTGAY